MILSGEGVVDGVFVAEQVGQYSVEWTAMDSQGTVSTPVTQVIVIADTIAPVISDVANVTFSYDEAGQLVGSFSTTPSAVDNYDGELSADAVTLSVTVLLMVSFVATEVGEYTLSWTATDAQGNTMPEPVTQVVVIEDTIAPEFESLAGLTMVAPVTLSAPTALDNIDGVIEATTDFDASEAGNYTVVWTATDAAGNTQTAEQALTILSLTFDDIAEIADITVEAEGELTAVTLPVSVSVSSGLLSATPDNVGPFALGETSVVWSVSCGW